MEINLTPIIFSFFLCSFFCNSGENVTLERAKADLIFRVTLENVKKATFLDDLDALSAEISYPLTVITSEKNKSKNISYKIFKIHDKKELASHYKRIFSGLNKALIECLELGNVTYDRSNGYMAAYGNIWFEYVLVDGDFKFKLSTISLKQSVVEKWVSSNCKVSKPH
jgi:hypothetical protein